MGIIEQYFTPFIFRLFDIPEPSTSNTCKCPLLQSVYENFNGGMFWHGALLVRPNRNISGVPLTVAEWNDVSLWKGEYGAICANVTFFAEDTFGFQFGVEEGRIVQFDPETAHITAVADSIESWCQDLCRDPDFYTGAPVLTTWEQKNHPLSIGYRLIPRQLFMMGGAFHSDNMIYKTDVEGMRIRAQFWKLTKNLPDGQKVIFRVEE
ncbi:MAG: SMI1/KNR4 family protein [Polyangiaceae bacterium]|nr:SMI1/KNR4 family protein [Polyangiaceae bacterium]